MPSEAIKRAVHQRANRCCEYCQTCQAVTGQAMHVDHIIPGKGDDLENLCLSCANCNGSKSDFVSGIDPHTGDEVPLFNPRTQQWDEHFYWVYGGLELRGKTAIGRATIERLKMNIDRVVSARKLWIIAGVHPPK